MFIIGRLRETGQCRGGATMPASMRGPAFAWRTFAVAVAAVLVFATALWMVAPPLYDTNDDVTIRLAVEGKLVPGQPATGFVLLTHSALAWAVATLNRVLPDVPWWDLVVSGMLLWALATFLALAWSAFGDTWVTRATALTAVLVVAAPLLTKLQFTISATLAGGAAAALAILELTSWRKPRRGVLAFAALLFAAATLVRPLAAMAGVACLGACLAPFVLLGDRPRRGLVRLTLSLAAAVTLFLAFTYVDGLLYRVDRAWSEYYRYNWMVVRLFEWGGDIPDRQAEAMRAASGWTANDWEMLTRFWGVDLQIHAFARLERIYEAAAQAGSPNAPGALTRLGAAVDANLRALPVTSASVLIVGAVLAVAFASRRGGTAAVLAVIAFGAVCVTFQAVSKELPFRVLAPIQACLLVALIITAASLRRPTSHLVSVMALSMLVALLLHDIRAVAAVAAADRSRAEQVTQEVAALQTLRPTLVVRHGGTFPAEFWWQPFRQPSIDLPSVALGWNNQNPLLHQFLHATVREPLLVTICSDPSIVVVGNPDWFRPATNYLRERFDMAVAWTNVYTASFGAWRCVPA